MWALQFLHLRGRFGKYYYTISTKQKRKFFKKKGDLFLNIVFFLLNSVEPLLKSVWKIYFLDVCKGDLHGSDYLVIRLKILHTLRISENVGGRVKTGLAGRFHCFDCFMVSGIYQWFYVSTTVTKHIRKSFGLFLKSIKHCREVVSLSGVSKRCNHCADRFLIFQYFIQNVPIQDLRILSRYIPWQCFCVTWAWLIRNRCATMLKLVKPIFNGHARKRRVTVCSIQALFDFTAPFICFCRGQNKLLLFLDCC